MKDDPHVTSALEEYFLGKTSLQDNFKVTEVLISIVIPCFNASETLGKTLDSVIEQDYSNYEVVIIDDGSSDSTPEIIQQYKKKDHRIRDFRQENNGVSAARNKEVNIAKSEFIAFLDSDDLFYKNSLMDKNENTS